MACLGPCLWGKEGQKIFLPESGKENLLVPDGVFYKP